MTVSQVAIANNTDSSVDLLPIAQRVRTASQQLALLSTEAKNRAIVAIAEALEAHTEAILT
ncbi:MAG: gamma-glutamyl-phosphate reductase, partial [Cyanobacteria bacterium P01_C01_bin.70]